MYPGGDAESQRQVSAQYAQRTTDASRSRDHDHLTSALHVCDIETGYL